ncbi:MAG: alpha/beta hydrolase family protein [Chitinophagales bacterium]
MFKKKIIALILVSCSINCVHSQDLAGPDTVSVLSGKLVLKGLIWFPASTGKFPAIIFCHGSYEDSDTAHDPLRETSLLGHVFASKGYIFFVLFRRGVALSGREGVNSTVLMNNALKEKGQEARNRVQLQQLEGDQLKDMISGIRFLEKTKGVDKNRMAIMGHSFGASLSLLVAEHRQNVKAVVAFSPGGYSWDHSFQLRVRLIAAAKNISAPVMIIHARNDYSINPGRVLDSMMNQNKKSHELKIYPDSGKSPDEGHNLIFKNINTWKTDVFEFLDKTLRH